MVRARIVGGGAEELTSAEYRSRPFAGLLSRVVSLNSASFWLKTRINGHPWKSLGADHPDVAVSLDSLASVYRSLGRFDEAARLNRRALVIREKKLGPAHPDVARSLKNLAMSCFGQKRYSDAEALYRKALPLLEESLGPKHPELADTLQSYGLVLRKLKRRSAALEVESRRNALLAPNR